MPYSAPPNGQLGRGTVNAPTYKPDQTPVAGHDDAGHVVLVEVWETREQYEEYRAWQRERGATAQLTEALAEPPIIRNLEVTDAGSAIAAEAALTRTHPAGRRSQFGVPPAGNGRNPEHGLNARPRATDGIVFSMCGTID